MNETPFKICPNCKVVWETIDEFLSDPKTGLAGYQVDSEDLEGGLFFFTHQQKGCFTTLAIPVTDLLSLNDHPLLEKRDEQLCSGSEFCQHQNDLSPRPKKCECVWVRDILQTIKAWPKIAK